MPQIGRRKATKDFLIGSGDDILLAQTECVRDKHMCRTLYGQQEGFYGKIVAWVPPGAATEPLH